MSDIVRAKTYEEILKEMTDFFRSRSGFYPDNASDIGIRLKVLASQVYSLNYKLNWIWKQSSPLSATDEFLDSHAAQKGLSRREGKYAEGELTFYLEQPLATDTDIERATVAATNTLVSAKRFETTAAATIPAGQTSVTVPAKAMEIGLEGNVSAGSIKVIENGASGLFVTNENAFTSGAQPETDEELRNRILETYSKPVFGASANYYKFLALSDSEVVSAGVVPAYNGAGTVKVALETADPVASQTVINRVSSLLNEQREMGIITTVCAASNYNLDVVGDITLKDGYSESESLEKCENLIRQYIQSLGVGDAFIKADIYKLIMDCEEVKNFVCYTPGEDKFVSADTLIREGNISLNALR